MIHLEIEHRTRYRYRVPVQFGPHRLVIRPREGHEIRVERFEIECRPPARLRWFRDVFDNSVCEARFDQSAPTLEIVGKSTISWQAPGEHTPMPILSGVPPVYETAEAPIASALTRLSFPEDRQALLEWLDGQGIWNVGSEDMMTVLLRLTNRINAFVSNRRRERSGTQRPVETLSRATGACRDMAAAWVDAARLLGFAARFVSGYLLCSATREGRGSTHAWGEAYLPKLGWLGFDPTIGSICGPQHIPMGLSHHPRAVMPVTGTFHGAPNSYLGLDISVRISEHPGLIAISRTE